MKKKLLTALVLASAVAFGSFAVAGCDSRKPDSGDVGSGSGEVDKVAVSGVTVTPDALNLEVGATSKLTANITPGNADNKAVTWTSDNQAVATVGTDGTVTAKSAGNAQITATTVDGGFTAKCSVTVKTPAVGDLALSYTYGGNECAAFEWADSNPAAATVKYKLTTETNYTNLDSALIRTASTSGTARADVLGLKGGSTYEFEITSSTGKKKTVTQAVTAYDRSGYAHFNYTQGVGAYNDDGTPKANAQIIYVSDATKNTVQATIGGESYTGICAILGGLSNSKVPVIVRVIGTIGAATWQKIDYNADKKYSGSKHMPESVVVGKNGKQLPTNSNTTQADLISGGYNSLDTSVWSELIGLDSRAKYKNGEYDTIWNNCPIKNAKNVTFEGVGEDARLFQWGLTWGSCSSIEVRNLTFEDYTEDACSFEGSVNSTTIEGFDSKNIWLHHNTFEEGMNYWDLSAEQDKHEGDGATDFKKLAYLTTSYNVHHKNHKTGLVGGGDETTTACVTFHHNYYNNNSSRLPLGREANMHMYNNYYYRSTGSNMSLRAGAYAFIENCYFDNAKTPIEVKAGNNPDKSAKINGAAKLLGNVFSGINYSKNSYIYEVTDRTKTVNNDNIFNKNFDTDASAFYYDAANKATKVSVMYTAEETKVNVPQLAGVQKRGGKTYIAPGSTGGNTGGSTTPDTPSGDTQTIPTYPELLARTDKIYANDFSSYKDGDKLAEFNGYGTAGIYSQPDKDQGYTNSYTEVNGGKTHQVTNVGVSDVKTNGKNTTTVIAFGEASNTVEGYFEITTTDVGTKWDIIKFVDSSSQIVFSAKVSDDKTKDLTYTVNGGTPVTPSQSFVWKANVTYKVYFKIDYKAGEITVNITDGSNVFNVTNLKISAGVSGIQLISSNKGQRYTSIDNLVICGE